MPAIPIRRVVIFGDSLSDIGRMLDRKISSLAGVDPSGRFSDGRNWVDFLWEKAGGDPPMYVSGNDKETHERSLLHLNLFSAGRHSDFPDLQLACYAEGGAVISSSKDGVPWGKLTTLGMLDSLEAQVARYEDEFVATCDGLLAVRPANTLHILWGGGNDVVTIERSPPVMTAMAEKLIDLGMRLLTRCPGSHVVIINLPDPSFMPRFRGASTTKMSSYKIAQANLNAKLKSDVWCQFPPKASSKFSLFEISDSGIQWEAAKRGIGAGIAKSKKSLSSSKRQDIYESTSLLSGVTGDDVVEGTGLDQLHPAAVMYEVIADAIAGHLVGAGFSYGDIK